MKLKTQAHIDAARFAKKVDAGLIGAEQNLRAAMKMCYDLLPLDADKFKVLRGILDAITTAQTDIYSTRLSARMEKVGEQAIVEYCIRKGRANENA